MKKNLVLKSFLAIFMQRKLMSITKLTSILLIMFTLSVKVYGKSQDMTVNLNFKKARLVDVFREIEKQTNYSFFYSKKNLDDNKTVDAKFVNEKLSVVVKTILGDKYYIKYDNKYIIITPKKAEDNKKTVIKGKVLDEKGNSLPGVTVIIKGTKIGVSTNVKGEFNIKGKKGDILLISFIGMQSKEVKYLGENLKVILKEKISKLEEVVCTGYQIIEKRKLTSAVTTVKGEDVIEPVSTSIDKMLQGKIPGMVVMNQSSTPGAAPKIRIRGSSSITGNREPVWVVDGVILEDPVPLSTEELNSMDKVNLIGNAISSLNPQDIERIDILKDASATAIYGTKAANGVIVITTKRGKRGPMRINYSSNYSFTSRPTYDGMYRMNSSERIDLSEEMKDRGLKFYSYLPTRISYEGALMDLWEKKISLTDFDDRVNELRNTNTDWFDILFRDAFSSNHSVSFSGANDKTSYYISMGYANNKGATEGVDLTRYNSTVNVSTRFNDKLKLTFGLRGSFSKTNRNHSTISMLNYAYDMARTIPAFNNDGSRYFYDVESAYNYGGSIDAPMLQFNILNELENTGNSNTTSSLNMHMNIDYKLNSHFNYRCMMSSNVSNNDSENWANERSFYISAKRQQPYGMPLPKIPAFKKSSQIPFGGEITSGNTRNINYTLRNTLSFRYLINDKHSISSTLGVEVRSSRYKGCTHTQYGYLPLRGKKVVSIDPLIWEAYANLVKNNPSKYTDKRDNLMSYYGTFSYGFDNKYILNFNIRGDASNRFGQDKSTRFLPVWSVSGRWNIHNESILKEIKWLNSLSVIGSYGMQGNVPSNNPPYLVVSLGTLDSTSEEYISSLNNAPNNKLKWEKTSSYNLGVDFSLFKNAFGGSVQLYKKVGKDQIVSRNITSTNGVSNVYINGGDIENKGWELSFFFNPISRKDFSLGFSLNTSKNYNKIINAGIMNGINYSHYIDGTLIKNGKAVNSFYSYKFNGLDNSGFPLFKDINIRDEEGNLTVNSRAEAYDRAFAYSGKREPDLAGGFNVNLRYKRLSINSLFAFSVGSHIRLNDLYKKSGQRLPFPQQNMSSEFVKRWREAGDEEHTNIPVISDDKKELKYYLRERNEIERKYGSKDEDYLVGENIWEMYNKSDLRVVPGDFLRCRSMSLSYSLSDSFCNKLSVNRMTLGLSVNNVFTLKDKALKGRDPEQVAMGAKVIPPQRTYAVSLNVNF